MNRNEKLLKAVEARNEQIKIVKDLVKKVKEGIGKIDKIHSEISKLVDYDDDFIASTVIWEENLGPVESDEILPDLWELEVSLKPVTKKQISDALEEIEQMELEE